MENQTKSTTMDHRDSGTALDATEFLTAEHAAVSTLFAEFEKMPSPAEKKRLADQICTELSVHAQIEEEIFYPAVKLALKDKELIPEARVEHAALKALIMQVEGVKTEDEMFDARIKVMFEYVKHHVALEQNEMFPKAKSTSLNMEVLGAKLSKRKTELLAQRHPR